MLMKAPYQFPVTAYENNRGAYQQPRNVQYYWTALTPGLPW